MCLCGPNKCYLLEACWTTCPGDFLLVLLTFVSVSNEWFNYTMLDPSKGFVSKLWLLSGIDFYRRWSKAGVGCFSAGQGEGSLHYLY
jgi:hypothetical protein